MSLYSSLTQVLAPFAAKINGLLTGWDGTKYNTPGEAVRQQIADLHVLIGDEPGKAIQSSAVSYGESDVETALDDVNGRLSDLKDVTTTTETSTQRVTESITPTWASGYMTQTGSTYSNDNYVYSSPISVSAGDVIQPKRGDGVNIYNMRYVTCFNGNNVVTDIGGTSVSTPYTVPDGCDSIVITISSAYVNAYVNRTYTTQTQTYIPILKPDVETLLAISAPAKPGRIAYSFDVSANELFTGTDDFQDQCGYRICFTTKISEINGIVKIGKGIGLTYGGGIGFDGTNLYQYFGTASDPVRTQAHGLTLKDYVSIILDIGYSKQAVVTISTNGGMYTWTIPVWRSYYGVLTVESVNALTGCVLSYASACAKKDIWVFGDSYISYTDTTRWMYYLVQTGHTDYLINGYPGRNSKQALAALKAALKMHHIPKTLVWLLGMNDKDAASAPNANWLSAIEEVMQICEDSHIELVLSTIPNVPSTATKNDMKNAYVRASGYRYIDFANAVSADWSSTWYEGMLASDNVHPDVQGAIALYSCAVAEAPELLL
jgi:hypothetical protein